MKLITELSIEKGNLSFVKVPLSQVSTFKTLLLRKDEGIELIIPANTTEEFMRVDLRAFKIPRLELWRDEDNNNILKFFWG